jgi:Fe-S oxidoreductase
MAGAFGAMKSKYELSLRVAEALVELVNNLPSGACVVASGASCRQQISHLTDSKPLHMAEFVADALAGSEAAGASRRSSARI